MGQAFVKIDLHGMRQDEAIKVINRAIAAADSTTYQIQLIHGYNRGTNLRSMIYDEYRYEHEVPQYQIRVRRACKTRGVHAEHIFKVRPAFARVFKHEYQPAEKHYEKRVYMPYHLRYFFKPFEQEAFFHHKYYSVEYAPEYVVPVGSVPYAREHPDDEKVSVSFEKRAARAAQGEVHVVAEPGGKRHMPSSPEIRYGVGYIRIVEVF